MATPARGFAPGHHYHVYNRGNRKDVIFRDDNDRRYFLSKLDQFFERDGIMILAYCLMDNHFHLAVRQDGTCPISKPMQSLLSGYSRMHNRKYGVVGPLFQSRFQTRLVSDEEDMAYLTRYIHLNPAPFTNHQTYRWSSYRDYVGPAPHAKKIPGICNPGPVLDTFGGSKTSYAIYCAKATSSEEPTQTP